MQRVEAEHLLSRHERSLPIAPITSNIHHAGLGRRNAATREELNERLIGSGYDRKHQREEGQRPHCLATAIAQR